MAAIHRILRQFAAFAVHGQTNPLSEITESGVFRTGPSGLSRERASSRCATSPPTHYGRICRSKRPEGPNIGLISSLSCYTRINEFGFIESPPQVKAGRVIDYVQIVNSGESEFKAGGNYQAGQGDDGARN